jgi:hypothetical protein
MNGDPHIAMLRRSNFEVYTAARQTSAMREQLLGR